MPQETSADRFVPSLQKSFLLIIKQIIKYIITHIFNMIELINRTV